MNWKESALFYFKSSGVELTRRIVEPILMRGGTYEDSQNRMKILLDEGYVKRSLKNKLSFELTEKGDLYITPYFQSVIELMDLVRPRIERVVENRKEIELKGGITGMYFTYTKMSMFRFHPFKGEEEALLFVRLPNLIGESISHKSNEIYITKEHLDRTTFLEDVIQSHLKMVDEFYEKDV